MQTNSHEKHINININDVHYKVTVEQMSGVEIKSLAGIPAGSRLFRDVPGPGSDPVIRDDEVVHLHNGDKFYDLPPGIKGEGNLPPIEQQIDRLKEDYRNLTITPQADGSIHMEIPDVGIAPGWTVDHSTILVIVPPMYPNEGDLRGFFCAPDIRLLRGQHAGGYSQSNLNARPMGYFCWSPNAWDRSRDTLWKYVKFCISRFEDAS